MYGEVVRDNAALEEVLDFGDSEQSHATASQVNLL